MNVAQLRKRPDATNQSSPPDVPTFADVSPEYRRLVAKREELEVQRAELEKERKAIFARLEMQKGQPHQNVRVAALLGDEVEGVSTAEDRQRLQVVTTMQRDIEQAIHTIAARVAVERGKASRIICEQVKGDYDAKVREVCLALINLNQRHRELAQLTDALDRADVSWTGNLHPMMPPRIGSPNDPQGMIAHHLREAVQHGFLRGEEIPEWFRRG